MTTHDGGVPSRLCTACVSAQQAIQCQQYYCCLRSYHSMGLFMYYTYWRLKHYSALSLLSMMSQPKHIAHM